MDGLGQVRIRVWCGILDGNYWRIFNGPFFGEEGGTSCEFFFYRAIRLWERKGNISWRIYVIPSSFIVSVSS